MAESVQKIAEQVAQAMGLADDSPTYTFPDFDSMPPVKDMPQGCAWGFFDRDGKKDELGTLNLLTPAVVLAANKEVQTGRRIQLDWSLDNVNFPAIGRKAFEHKIVDLAPHGFTALDDEIHMNTQSGSQWDGLKHAAHQETGMYYNGVTHEAALAGPVNGTHRWVEAGGIAGRGVLLDWLRWWEATKGEAPAPHTRHEIRVDELDAVAKAQGVTLRQGDILMIRSGYVRWHNGATKEQRQAGTQGNEGQIGLEANDNSVRWLFKHHFAAVVGDTFAFEAWPPPQGAMGLHEWLLASWGTPIGEMWNMEGLSAECERQGRWSFFLTSAPLHVVGGVGSPPGAIAIF